MKDFFFAQKSVSYDDRFIIGINFERLPLKGSVNGSYNVLCARVMDLNYADYLRMCRDVFGAELLGKDSKYPFALFKRGNALDALLKVLNTRTKFLLYRKEHPYEIVKTEYGIKKMYDNGDIEEAKRKGV